MIDRHINLIGASNFRDLGGYETEDGMRLKYGVIYRSDNLSHLTDIDLKKINEIGIKTVCFKSVTAARSQVYSKQLTKTKGICLVEFRSFQLLKSSMR